MGRFTYMDADEKRPSLETLMEDYWRLLPEYQPSIKDPEKDLDIKRVLIRILPNLSRLTSETPVVTCARCWGC
jgi:hypothetical protein